MLEQWRLFFHFIFFPSFSVPWRIHDLIQLLAKNCHVFTFLSLYFVTLKMHRISWIGKLASMEFELNSTMSVELGKRPLTFRRSHLSKVCLHFQSAVYSKNDCLCLGHCTTVWWLRKFVLTLFWQNFRESNVFTK